MTFKKKLVCSLTLGFATIASFLCAIFFLLSANFSGKAFAEEVWNIKEEEVVLEKSYIQGEEVTIPKMTLSINGEEPVDADFSVEFPSGKTTSESKITLDEVGNYTVNYFKLVKGRRYYKEPVSFLAKANSLSFADLSLGSSYYYGEYQGNGPKPTTEGLYVRLAKNDVLKVNQTIDVDTLSTSSPLIELFITPDTRGVADFDNIIIKLIDIYDETNYLAFDLHWKSDFTSGVAYSWLTSGASNQGKLAGYEDGKGYHTSDGWGTPVKDVSFVAQHNVDNKGVDAWSGAFDELVPDKAPAKIYYDPLSNQTKVNGTDSVKYDDPSIFGENLWNGFPSGMVRMEISAKNYRGSTANFCIVAVNSVSVDINAGGLDDTTPPEVVVETEFETMPFAKVGKSYILPSAKAFDITFGACDVSTEIFYNYAMANPTNVTFSAGSFVPDLQGEYTVVYSAKDLYGNEGKAFLTIIAKKDLDPIDYDLPSNISELDETDVKLGTLLSLDAPEIRGGAGGNVVTTFYTYNGGEAIPVTGSFRLEDEGNYSIIYKVIDYISDEPTVKTVSFTAIPNEEMMFNEDVSIPKVFIAELEYQLPILYASDYSSGRKQVKLAKVEVTDKNGPKVYDSGEKFIPEVENNGDEISVKYFCEGTVYKTFTSHGIVGKYYKNGKYFKKYVDMLNFFYGDNIEATFNDPTSTNGEDDYSTGCAIVTKETAKVSAWSFASVQVADSVNVVIKTLSDQPRIEAMDFVLVDSVDESYSLTFSLVFNGGSVFLFSGNETAEFKNYESNKEYEIKYSKGKLSFGGVSVAVKQFDDGREFNGFPSSKVYISLANKSIDSNVVKGGRYLVLSVCGHIISHYNNDSTPPAFALIGDLSGAKTKGDVLTIPAAACADVFNPNSAVFVSVYFKVNDDEEPVLIKDTDNTLLDKVPANKEYEIVLSQIGTYQAVYEFAELGWSENKGKSTFVVNVYDDKAPEVRFVKDYSATVNRGEIITFGEYTVSDDFNSKEELTVIRAVESSGGKFILLSGDEFVPQYTGTYRFIVLVRDVAGNTAMASYSVEVK